MKRQSKRTKHTQRNKRKPTKRQSGGLKLFSRKSITGDPNKVAKKSRWFWGKNKGSKTMTKKPKGFGKKAHNRSNLLAMFSTPLLPTS